MTPATQPRVTQTRYAVTPAGLDDLLGDPGDPDNPFGDDVLLRADRDRTLPAEQLAVLNHVGLAEHYVPAEYGGALRSYPKLLQLVRTVARRDITVAVAHASTFLGAVATWVAGSEAQRYRLAEIIRSGGVVSCALTEFDHGSDLLATEMFLDTATDDLGVPMPVALRGTKWLINNAGRADMISVLARTRQSGGPRGFGVVLVDRHRLAGEMTATELPDTIGMRAAALCAMRIETERPGELDVITFDKGIDATLLSLQLTRTLCAGLSLGAADRMLSHVAVLMRTGIVRDTEHTRRVLNRAYTDHLINEAVAAVTARSIHLLPGELALHSAVVKFLIPTRTERLLRDVRGVIPPDYAVADPIADKIERDHRVVSLFDGNTVVNLASLIGQFATFGRSRPDSAAALGCGRIHDPLPSVNTDALRLAGLRGSSVLAAAVQRDDSFSVDVDAAVRARLDMFDAGSADLLNRLPDFGSAASRGSSAAFTVAEQVAAAVAAAMCVRLWSSQNNPTVTTDINSIGSSESPWIVAALDRLLPAMGVCPRELSGLPAVSASIEYPHMTRWPVAFDGSDATVYSHEFAAENDSGGIR